jgi:hypothetical protein
MTNQSVPAERARRCPTCDSPNPTLHPSMQSDSGEVQICENLWHNSAPMSAGEGNEMQIGKSEIKGDLINDFALAGEAQSEPPPSCPWCRSTIRSKRPILLHEEPFKHQRQCHHSWHNSPLCIYCKGHGLAECDYSDSCATPEATSPEEAPMRWSIFADKDFPNDWHVEAIDKDSGDIFVALFSGPEAEKRAREYAEWQEAKGRERGGA